MNRRALWLLSWLFCVLITKPLYRVPTTHFTFAQLQSAGRSGFARATIAWVGATLVAIVIVRWVRRPASALGRAFIAAIAIGCVAALIYAFDLVIEVPSAERASYVPVVILNNGGAVSAGFAASFWLAGRQLHGEREQNQPLDTNALHRQ